MGETQRGENRRLVEGSDVSADALELIGIEKSFPGVRALRGVSLSVAAR